MENQVIEEEKQVDDAVEVAADTPKKRGRKKENAGPQITDEEVLEFMEWKKQKAEASRFVCEAPDDDQVRRAWKEESRMVKGIFRMHETPGGGVSFAFKKYKWDPVRWYNFQDGETYEIPLGVARHLNQNCSYEVHSNVLGPDGMPTIDKNKKKSRMNFESTEFAFA